MSQENKRDTKKNQPADRIVAYIKTYYANEIDPSSSTFQIQEQLRTQAAVNFDKDVNRAQRGWTAIDDIKKLDRQQLSTEFAQHIDQVLKSLPTEDKTNNVRGQVKSIWTWPLNVFLPWRAIDRAVNDKVVKLANDIKIQPKLGLVDGKLYLLIQGFREALWDSVANLNRIIDGLDAPLERNIEPEHLTLVNSDVIAKLPADQLSALLAKWQKQTFALKCTGLRHTVSLDWAPFSVCLVAAFESGPELTAFFVEFNSIFKAHLSKPCAPSLHTTVAVDRRSLDSGKRTPIHFDVRCNSWAWSPVELSMHVRALRIPWKSLAGIAGVPFPIGSAGMVEWEFKFTITGSDPYTLLVSSRESTPTRIWLDQDEHGTRIRKTHNLEPGVLIDRVVCLLEDFDWGLD